jgi:sulfur-oxidizing protein SoxA
MGIYTKLAGMALATIGAVALAGSVALADADNKELVVDGTPIATKFKAPKGSPLEVLYSGWRFRKEETQDLQTDDFDNPGFVSVALGEELWSTATGSKGKSCASCHNEASESMKGVRASMPKWDKDLGKPISLEQQINECLVDRMGAKKLKFDHANMLGYSSYVGLQSRGMPVNVQTDGPMAEWADKGKKIYYTRVGQLDMSCANCHENNFGNYIRADHLSQGQSNGFPLYRLKWQKSGSIHRRFKGCMKNIRAKPYKAGSDEFLALELYVASRGQGMTVETPAVRN